MVVSDEVENTASVNIPVLFTLSFYRANCVGTLRLQVHYNAINLYNITMTNGSRFVKDSFKIKPFVIPKEKKVVAVAHITVKQNFTEELNHNNSAEYKKVERKATFSLTKIYEQIPGFFKVLILGFRKGSIVIKYEVIFDTSKQTAGNPFKKQMTEATEKAISNGTLGGFHVVKDSFEIEKIRGPEHKGKQNYPKWSLYLWIGLLAVVIIIVMVVTHVVSPLLKYSLLF